jgi:hypothetical protein
VRRADNLTTLVCRLSRNLGALTSWSPQGHVGLFWGYFTENLISPIHYTLIPDILPLDDAPTLLFLLEHHIISALCGTSETTRNTVLYMVLNSLGKQKTVTQHI